MILLGLFLISKLNETQNDPKEHEKYVQLAEESVYEINKSIENLPADLTIATHICRGNFKSTFLFSGGYEPIAKYLGQLNYDRFFLEYDSDRAGDLKPIKQIWNNRDNVTIVLGLITSKNGELEDPITSAKRITEAGQLVPLNNLALSTQCGFASTEEGNILSEVDQWKKIKFVVKIANNIWKSF